MATQPLSGNSRRLLIDGLPSAQLLQQWSKPQVVLRNNYITLTYGQPPSLPPFDEQWVYPTDTGHRVIYFNAGTVVLAVEEWTGS